MGDAAGLHAFGVSVLLPAYRRGVHVQRTALSWVQAWMAEETAAPALLELVIVDDGMGDGAAEQAVDPGWMRALVASWWRRYGGTFQGQGRSLAIRVIGVDHPQAKASKSSVAALNHAAAVARGDVLVLSNAESLVLFGDVPADVEARCRLETPEAPAPIARIGGDPRLGGDAWYGTRERKLRPFVDILRVRTTGGYTVGACVNMGRGRGVVAGAVDAAGAPASIPAEAGAGAVSAGDLLATVPPVGMDHADAHTWRSHPSWRATDLHWAGVMRRADFWGVGGFSARWAKFSTGWGEDGEFAWRVRLWCDGVGESVGEGGDVEAVASLTSRPAPRPFRVSTNLVVAHQWHPSAGGAAAHDVVAGEALYDLARRDVAWVAAGSGGLVMGAAGAALVRDRWRFSNIAFPGARVTSHLFEATGYDRSP